MRSKNMMGFPYKNQSSDTTNPLVSIQNRMSNLLNDFFTEVDPFISGGNFPLLNVHETDKEITVTAELPGLSEADIKLEVDKNHLTIKGEKKSEQETKDQEGRHHLREISYGSFSRSLSFPFEINSEKSQASFSNGVLKVTFQKPEENVSTPKQIPITSQTS